MERLKTGSLTHNARPDPNYATQDLTPIILGSLRGLRPLRRQLSFGVMLSTSNGIPKMIHHIHQIWFQGRRNAPKRYHEAFNKWERMYPTAEYHFWDENGITQLIASDYPDYLDQWQSIDKMIKKCDCARYLILHRYGGVYADADTIPLRPIDALITELGLENANVILSEESSDPASWKSAISKEILASTDLKTIVGNAVLISKPYQEFWVQFVDRAFSKKNERVLESFSTWHLTRFLNTVKHSGVQILPYRYLLGSDHSDPLAYCLHSYDATWFDTSVEHPWEA